ncbi:putative LRR receptor-like serine/threonine-protein kinase [Morus notabilis]|uniref:non-specific serine/threonine protein kinase n=1 Tax=Morus notabilis TaxID=981085 RepID=W9QUS0_9ROSA|nr:putative LRR receptor-like serine/threonine-protein kinase [Morus notabilis]
MSELSLQRLFRYNLIIYLNLQILWIRGAYMDRELPANEAINYFLFARVLSTMGLSGTIDAAIADLQNLRTLILSNNKLQGPIPASLGNLFYLNTLDLSNNQLTGTIPDSIGNLRNLQWLFLNFNMLSGSIPEELGYLYKLQRLNLAENSLTGSLPDTLGNLRNLISFVVSGNEFSGSLPLYVKSWTRIETLAFQGNNFQGRLPEGYFTLSNLQELFVSDLNTSPFELPPTSEFTKIYSLVLRSCSIIGSIPKYIGELSSLKYLDLSFNSLTSGIPETMRSNLIYMLQPDQMRKAYNPGRPKFYSLFINSGGGQTNFNGKRYDADNETSQNFYNWACSFSGDFYEVTVNSSDYTKRVPCKISNSDTSLYEEARLSPVSLTYHGFSLRKGRYNVTLHFAEIVYTDDSDYNGLKKRRFDVYIQGKRELKDLNIREKAGAPNIAVTMNFTTDVNDSLLTIHLFWAGKGSFANAPAFNGPLISAISVNPLFDVSSEKLSPWYIALISVASLVIALLLVLAFAWSMGWLEDKELREPIKIGQEIPEKDMKSKPKGEDNDIKVPLKVLINATGKFSDAEDYKLGSGNLGTVYKAEVKDRKITVAVKRLFAHHKGKISDSIKQDIIFLESLEHENLIKLWDIHVGKRQQLLVYEYMEKKSLESVLFDPDILELSWKTRQDICLGIAKGLAFLHTHPRFQIVHGNIKTSNILLDGDFKPKLSDFGLAKVYTDEDQPIILKKEAPNGYLAHEYLQASNPTKETDIFSFGVVLLEIVCGLKNKVAIPGKESRYLLNEAHACTKFGNKRGLEKLIDVRLENNMNADEINQAVDVLNLAVMCTDISPSCRPNVSRILSVLTGKETIDQIRQSMDAQNKKDTEVADKTDVSKSKETTSSSSTSTDIIEYDQTK